MNIIAESALTRLLSFIALSADFPTVSLRDVLGSGRYPEQVVAALRQRKLITTHAGNGLRSYRLTSAGRKTLADLLPERCGPYLELPQATKSEYPRRLRNHRVAETYVQMERAGIEIFPDRKPWPFTAMVPNSPHITAFYGSREVRSCGLESAKIKNARFTGVLVSPAGTWLTYHTGAAVMKWESKSEQRTKALVASLLNGRQTLLRPSDVGGVMIGQDMDTAYELLASNGGVKRAYFRVDNTFEHFPFIPLGEEGVFLLKVLCDKPLNAKLQSVLLAGHDLDAAADYLFTCDAFNAQGLPVLLAYDFDLQRINSFVTGLHLHGLTGSVICFDFQAETLRRYAQDKVVVETIDHQKFERKFLSSKLPKY